MLSMTVVSLNLLPYIISGVLGGGRRVGVGVFPSGPSEILRYVI